MVSETSQRLRVSSRRARRSSATDHAWKGQPVAPCGTSPSAVSETADGDVPHGASGCPFQAWSVAETLRARRRLSSAQSP